MTRVVYLDHVARLSGGEIALLRLLPHLDRVDPHVLLAEDGPLVEELRRVGIPVEVLPLASHARELRKERVRLGRVPASVAWETARYSGALARRLRALRPDLVHTNSLKAGVYGALAARLAGIPLIWHVRDHISEPYLTAFGAGAIRLMTRRFPAAVVANSRSTMQTLGPLRDSLVLYSVLPEVMSPSVPQPRGAASTVRYGVVGRLAPWKGQDLFLRAFARAFPDGQERAIVVGAALFGEDAYAQSLPSLAAELGIAERVEFRGQRADIWSELARMDVLVHSSVTPEPFGQVVLEGMEAGLCVIAAAAGGPAEVLEHRRTGLLYAPADRDALSAALIDAHDPELRSRLGSAARLALAPYRPEVVAESLQRLYDDVLERRTRRS